MEPRLGGEAMEDRKTALTDRITFAEDWLDRARRQIQEGHLDHGALTMILAEAELHRAREVGLPVATISSARLVRPRWSSRGAAAALIVTAVVAAVSVATSRPRATVEAHDVAMRILTLPGATGERLRMVTAAAPIVERTIERTVVRRMIVRVPVPAVIDEVRQAPPASIAPAAAPMGAVVSPSSPAPAVPAPAVEAAPAPAAPAPAPTPALLSEADVIDLVLAAERSLRRSAKQ
ncbi:MAG: hypothetical protein ACT4P5_05245 [Armatimonadota bacterium]